MTLLSITAHRVCGRDPCSSLSTSSAPSQWSRGSVSRGGESPECRFAGGSLVSPGQQPKEQMDGLFQGQPCSIRLC